MGSLRQRNRMRTAFFLLCGALVRASTYEVARRTTCKIHTVVSGDYCDAIAAKYSVTTKDIISWNVNTYKWNGCSALQINMQICVSAGTPPPPKVNPDLQCGPESKGNATCPLRACCSAYGYCGLTEEFCNKALNGEPCISNCGTTTLKVCGGELRRKVGYYAAWAARRPCNKFAPQDLDLTGFTHVIFSFATITESMDIVIAPEDQALLHELVKEKWRYPGLKVLIGVGGWAFSTGEPTKSLFSVMISTPMHRAMFVFSVKIFLQEYGLDGLDIDMEYPGAIERNAPTSDTPNLSLFLETLRSQLLYGEELSIATPAGFWFLKGFELDKIAGLVDFINMMSYDYHGPWDAFVNGEDGIAKPHTSIKDIEDSAKLYTRAGIDLKKVNLGLAWYGRSYNVGSCRGTKCKMTGGGSPGVCTGESGVLSQKEIWDLKPVSTFDAETQTFWYNQGSDFVTYDDLETCRAKTEFASKYCFGGTMIWSLDQVKPAESKPNPDDGKAPVPGDGSGEGGGGGNGDGSGGGGGGGEVPVPDDGSDGGGGGGTGPPETPIPEISAECHTRPSDKVINDCRIMVRDIFKTYPIQNRECLGIAGFRTVCNGDCCMFVAMYEPQIGSFEAREIKAAAQAILDKCYPDRIIARDMQNSKIYHELSGRTLPALVPILARWAFNTVAYAMKRKWDSTLALTVQFIIDILFPLFNWVSDKERKDFVIKATEEGYNRNPEMNMILVKPAHKYDFETQSSSWTINVTKGLDTVWYTVYSARSGTFELLGDGDFINWGFMGNIERDPKNPKRLILSPPGVSYGLAVTEGRLFHEREVNMVPIGIGLGDKAGCIAPFIR